MIRIMLTLAAVFLAVAGVAGAGRAAEKFIEMKSPAGIAYWYQTRPDLPKASLVAGWRDGLGYSLPGKVALPGIAYQWMARGAGERSGNELGEAMKDIGAEGRLYGDGWRTYASLIAAPDKLAAAADISRDVLMSPRLEAKELERIRKGFIDRNRQADAQAEAIAYRTAFRYAFGDSAWTQLYNSNSLEAITRDDIEAWRKRVLTRDNLVVAASGPLTGDAYGAIVDTLFAGLPEKGDLPSPPDYWFQPQPKTIVVQMEQAQTVVLEMAATDVRADRERLKSALAVDVFGSGDTSRLFRRARGQLGATYDVRAGLMGYVSHDVLAIRGAFAHDKAVAALAALDEEYALWQDKGVTAEEFEAARSRSRSGFEQAGNRPGSDAQNFVTTILVGRPPNDAFDYGERLGGYTADVINTEIAAKFPREPLLKIIVTPDASLFKSDCVIKAWREADSCH